MKVFLLFLTLFSTTLGLTRDCFYCPPNLNWTQPQVPEWPIEYTKIEKVIYARNPKASFCKRPSEMVDTIVLHHSETPNTETAIKINDFHLSRGTPQDPWYMIAYTYVINSPYLGGKAPVKKVTEGRPLDIVGAHAGTNVYIPMSILQKKLWDEGQVTCGKEDEEFKIDPSLVVNDKIKANVTTIGLVIIGNYSPFSKLNPNGYSSKKPRYPTKDTQDLIARMSCQLQKKYPNMKMIKWHSYYHSTSCPGTIKNYISQIRELTRKYGCEFN